MLIPLRGKSWFSSVLFDRRETQDTEPCDLVRVLRFSLSGLFLHTLSSLLPAILSVTPPCL